MCSPHRTMHTEALAYWTTFSIPGLFILLRIICQRLIDGPPWKKKYLYFGVDLSIFSLAAFVLLQAQGAGFVDKAIRSLIAVVVVFFLLVYQITVHQVWEKDEKHNTGKTWMLCVLSNLIGLMMVGTFVFLKVRNRI